MASTLARTARTDLERELEHHRRELTGYCYRMLGSASEAEDAVQETMLKAWRAIDGFEGRSSLRSWLYRIAHHVCMDMHRSPQRRARPMDVGPASRAAEVVLPDKPSSDGFVHPIRDDAVIDLGADPAEVAAARESIRLAFVAALARLPARQRASLILCDVLRWQASEVAALLETSVASVNSALQRARATLASRRDEPLDAVSSRPHDEVIDRYVDAFERYDVPAIVDLMRHDVVLSMPPWDVWLEGPDDVASWLRHQGSGCEGARLVPIAVNGTAGFGNYRLTRPGRWDPFGIQVIEVAGGRIVGQHNFLYPDWFEAFGLPPHLEA
jgi:RNA polymerase sigma-70 factor (ECF subfamily)